MIARLVLPGFAALLLCAGVVPADAGQEGTEVGAATYAGAFAGYGRAANRLVDVDGFANWGNPGSRLDYDGSGPLGGFLVGRKFDIGALRARIEFDAAIADISVGTRRLDPGCPDEAAETRLKWVASLRAGIEESIGGVTVFLSAGPGVARIVNAVTDTDYSGSSCLERDLRLDADDSFRDSSTHLGLAVGAGAEIPLADGWIMRFEGSWLDFGRSSYTVNHSENNSCGAGGPRAPCTFTIENRLGILRLAVIMNF